MNKKLTLLVDEVAISKGKSFAAKNGTSLSGMVEDYFLLLGSDLSLTESVPVSKKLQELTGIGEGTFGESDYLLHREQKYS